MLPPWKQSYDQPRQHTKNHRYHLADKGLYSQTCGFSSSHVWMWELDCKESWAPKNWYFWTVVLEKTLESPLDCKESQPVHPKGNQSWIFIQRTDATWCKELTPWKRPCCWARLKAGREELTEDKMVGWHYQVDGHEFEQTPRDGDRQGGLACCNSWRCKESDTTEQLNWTELND